MTTTRYAWTLLRAGPIKLDGGGMFGLIPRVVWSKTIPTDEQHRITLSHNCLLLRDASKSDAPATPRVLIEAGTGDKLDEKMRAIFGLTDRTVRDAVAEVAPVESVKHAIVTHLHFDHAGGLTGRARDGETPHWTDAKSGLAVVRTFGDAEVIVQKREWADALANNSVMTRTYYRDHLEPIQRQVRAIESPPPFEPGHVPNRDALPKTPLRERLTEVRPGIFVFLTPGHTWAQQAVMFMDDRDRTVIFVPDILPTVHHVGVAYSLAYDVEPYTTMINKRWLLDEAARNDWLLVLDHEPGNPCVRVRPNGKGWYKLVADEA